VTYSRIQTTTVGVLRGIHFLIYPGWAKYLKTEPTELQNRCP